MNVVVDPEQQRRAGLQPPPLVVTQYVRVLHGLKSIVVALIKRFHEGNQHVFEAGFVQFERSGIDDLNRMVLEIHALELQLQLAHWLDTEKLSYEEHSIRELHRQRRDVHSKNKHAFFKKWQLCSADGSDDQDHQGLHQAKLMNDYVMESAQL